MSQNAAPLSLDTLLEGTGLDPNSLENGKLFPGEVFWRDHQPWLKECGYLLRARYQPDWVASWLSNPKKLWIDCEDGKKNKWSHLLDATSIKDGSRVMLKQVRPSESPYEAEIGQMFSSEPLVSDPRNRCAPIHEVLTVPDEEDMTIIVMPLLQPFFDPKFETIGEVVDFFSQISMGLQFMHMQNVAHRDVKFNNIMIDARPLYPYPPHPYDTRMRLDYTDFVTPTSRSHIPVKYYLVDFGISKKYSPGEKPLELPWGAGDKTIPEFAKNEPCDPFAVDVYCLGNVMRRRFLEGNENIIPKRGFGFMKSLIANMVQDDPKARPSMDEVVKQFDAIRKNLSIWTLRSRLADNTESGATRFFRSLPHWTKQFGRILKGMPSIPTLPKA